MKRVNFLLFTMLLASSVFLSGCQPTTSIGECIPPPDLWEFPVRATITPGQVFGEEKEIPPSGSWQVEASLPPVPSSEDNVYDLVFRSPDEVWVLMYQRVLRYRMSTHTWEKISTINGIDLTPADLFVSKDGTLWGFDLSLYDDPKNAHELPLLIRYDAATEQFVFVRDNDNLLNSAMKVMDISESRFDQNGKLWMLVVVNKYDQEEYTYQLISFDPENLQATVHLTVPAKHSEKTKSRLGSLAITPDGRVWIADQGKEQLYFYDPASKKTEVFSEFYDWLSGYSSEDMRGSFSLYVDQTGRMWVDDRGWLDFSSMPTWHSVIRSPVFIGDSLSPENMYGWIRPSSMYQSSDGSYWFTSINGMVNLNPETGKWCRFTTGYSPIIEDDQENVWIAIYGKLYKFHLPK